MTTVLIIDDEDHVRDVLRQVLEREKFMVMDAAGGVQGLAALSENAADVIIVDMIMPGMNGVDVIRKIRKRHADARILAISGGGNVAPIEYEPSAIATTAYLASAKEAGAHRVLTKPFERQDIVDAVRELAAD